MIWRGIALTSIGLISGVAGLWAADRDVPVAVRKVEVVTPVVAPGGQVKVAYHVERHRSCAVKIERLLFDHDKVRITLEDINYAAPPGPLGQDEYVTAVTIPRTIAQGSARYKVITRYECNVFHRLWPIVVQAADVQFEVRGPPTPGQLPIEIVPRN